ncbi:MAG: alanine--glyoxylate aminotransferase family protein [Candidatus Odinarchaeum yellowstonii]|uniref:Alanine--glyoxylate aminotransferase family protein n=1 Tax=Odinarchaeota yellowstonii (strain LCB_4) TaxID=1841599 RepID=A0AAF0D321_ODILC|nr:MAG: alanine--glyoxylate aminotransferase family protein [Candidatus Odinarchaeum yellowstonii]
MNEDLLMLPGPTNVPDEIRLEEAKKMINHRGELFHNLYKELQTDLKYLFQTDNPVYILTSSGTGAVECAASNLVRKDDKVVVPVNGEFGIRLADIFEIYGAKVIRVPFEWGEEVNPNAVKETLEKNPDTSLLAFVYNETSTGVRNNAKKLAEIGKKLGTLVLCDAISNLGGDELYTDKWGLDIVVSGSQKCISCPPGLAFITLNETAWRKVENSKPHINYYWNLEKIKKFHEKNETPFTPAVSLLFALNKALKIIAEEGIEKRVLRHKVCSRAVIAGATAIGFKLYPKKEEFASYTVNAFNLPPNITDSDVKKHLLEKHGIAISGGIGPTKGQIIRIGTIGDINRKQVEKTLTALEECLISKGLNIKENTALAAASKIFKENKF